MRQPTVTLYHTSLDPIEVPESSVRLHERKGWSRKAPAKKAAAEKTAAAKKAPAPVAEPPTTNDSPTAGEEA